MASGEDAMALSIEPFSEGDCENIAIIAKASKEDSGTRLLAGINQSFDVASEAIDLAKRSQLYKVELPPGYTLGDLAKSAKDKDAVRAIVKDSRGKLNGDVALKAQGIAPAQIATLGLAAAAAVVGQAYMTEISDSLHSIDEKLDTVMTMIAGEQRARIKNALVLARDYSHLLDEYSKTPAALIAARNEIEAKYNDVGEVVTWIVEQLDDVEKRALSAKAREKEFRLLVDELHRYEKEFLLALQTMSALAITRMQFDDALDGARALSEEQRLAAKASAFEEKRRRVAGVLELRVGEMKGAPIALPTRSSQASSAKPADNIIAAGIEKAGGFIGRVVSQNPRDAAKERVRGQRFLLLADLRSSKGDVRMALAECRDRFDRATALRSASCALLTDGDTVWFIEEATGGE